MSPIIGAPCTRSGFFIFKSCSFDFKVSFFRLFTSLPRVFLKKTENRLKPVFFQKKTENRNSKTEPVILGTSSTLLPHIPEKNPVIFSTIMPPIFGEIYEGIHQDAHFKNKRLHPRASMGVSIPY